jgi:sodium/pantothenate symporter
VAGARLDVLIPLIIYSIVVFLLGFYSLRFVSRAARRAGKGFLAEYLTGDRNMGGFVLAMTLVATYLSASSFIGGPGAAASYGLVWVFLAMSQMPTGYFTLSVLGKKFAIVARKINAVTVTDFLRERYESKFLIVIISVSLVFFLIASMTAQFVGAARLLEGAAGISYQVALTFFGLTVLLYTIIGGFRAVALTDTLQGLVMTAGMILLFGATIYAGGGVTRIIQELYAIDPGLISPLGTDPGTTSVAWVTSFWILVGFGVIALPQVATRAMSYRDSASMNSAIIYGTVVSMVLLLGMHLIGAFGRVLVGEVASGDLVVPVLTTHLFPNWLAGLVLAAPLAAAMSTVDSQLLVAVGAIVNDVYANLINRRIKRAAGFTLGCSIAIGAIVFLCAFNPPELLVWLNLHAIAGLIATFLWPVLLGLYWKRANTAGAFASIIAGAGSYLFLSSKLFQRWLGELAAASPQLLESAFFVNLQAGRPLGMHAVVAPVLISLAAFILFAYLTPRPSSAVIRKFWGV